MLELVGVKVSSQDTANSNAPNFFTNQQTCGVTNKIHCHCFVLLTSFETFAVIYKCSRDSLIFVSFAEHIN